MKPEKERGPDKSVCYGYGSNKNKVTPDMCTPKAWCCYGDTKFITEESITCTLYDPSSSVNGSVIITGATGGEGNRAKYVNGTFELTTGVCNGMPVYRKKGDHDTWLEMVKTKSGLWRWYIKPTKEKGPDSSVCYGYGVSSDIVFPHECDPQNWYCHDGTGFKVQPSITATLFPGACMTESALKLKSNRAKEWATEKAGLQAEVIACFYLV